VPSGRSHVAGGYQVLLIGKQRALEGEQNLDPWAEEVEGRWDATLERCAARWGVGGGVKESRQVTCHRCGTAAPPGQMAKEAVTTQVAGRTG
jgi:hypothetical protein